MKEEDLEEQTSLTPPLQLTISISYLKMFQLVLALVLLVNVVTAFLPASRMSLARVTSLKAFQNYEDEIGAQPPLGFWDPLGLLKDADRARFDRLRYVETKHGRIAMLAILGHIVTTAGIRLPGEIAFGVPFSSIKAGLAAFDNIPTAGVIQLFFFIGLLELGFGARQEDIEEAQIRASGWDEETVRRKKAIELNNGRAAQMGILGLVIHEKLNNDPYIINSLLGYPVPFNQ